MANATRHNPIYAFDRSYLIAVGAGFFTSIRFRPCQLRRLLDFNGIIHVIGSSAYGNGGTNAFVLG